jgi:hypothetical protein
MPTGSIIATVVTYLVIALLLLSLNLTSRWRWWIKGGAIAITGLFFLASFLVIKSLLGWPTQARMPARFELIASRVVEPDPFIGNPGAVFLWVEEIGDDALPNGRPRSYKLGYTEELADTVQLAQDVIATGEQVQGTIREEPAAGQPEAGDVTPTVWILAFNNNIAPVPLPAEGAGAP